jgi:hypothetical protein
MKSVDKFNKKIHELEDELVWFNIKIIQKEINKLTKLVQKSSKSFRSKKF